MTAEVYSIDTTSPGSEPRRLGVLGALIQGARRAARLWPVLLIMLLGTLLSAGLLALIPAQALLDLSRRPVIADMAAGIRAWKIVDLFGQIGGMQVGSTSSPASTQFFLLLLGFAVMPLVGGVVSAFLYGGMLLAYSESAAKDRLAAWRSVAWRATAGVADETNLAAEPQAERLSPRRFLWGCWHWFGGYLALALIQALLFFGVAFLTVTLAVFLFRLGPAGTAGGIALLVVVLVLWLMLFELARVRMVLNGTRNPFRGIGLAFGDLFRHLLALLAFYTAALLVLLVVQIVFRLFINPNVPLELLLLAVLVQQGFILLRLFLTGARLAGLVDLLGGG